MDVDGEEELTYDAQDYLELDQLQVQRLTPGAFRIHFHSKSCSKDCQKAD